MKYLRLLLLLLLVCTLHIALYFGRILDPVVWTKVENIQESKESTEVVERTWDSTIAQEQISGGYKKEGSGWKEGIKQPLGTLPKSKSSTDYVYSVKMDYYTGILLGSFLCHTTVIAILWIRVQQVAGGDATR